MSAVPLSLSGMQSREIIDERPILHRFNRLSLFYILKVNGFDVDDQMPKTRLIQLAEAHPEKINLNKVTVFREQFGGYRVVRPDQFKKEDNVLNEEHIEKRKDYEKMKKTELIALANEAGIQADHSLKHQELVELLLSK